MTPLLRSSLLALAVLLRARAAEADDEAEEPEKPATETPAPTPPVIAVPSKLPPPRPAPIGHAAPPTEAATRSEGPIRVGLEVFASYLHRTFQNEAGETTWFHTFDLERAHAAIDAEAGGARGRLLVESTRSASEGALTGVAGDSFVLRIREAWGSYRPIPMLEASAGVLPTATIPELDGTWMMRAVAPSALELAGFASPADVGVKVKAILPNDYGFVSTAAYNGEGYTNRELNRGKNTELAAEIHPFARTRSLLPLGMFASYVAGSTGTALARADRVTAGLVWQGERVRAGAFAMYAIGVGDVSRLRGALGTVFVRVEPIDRWLLGARADHVIRDLEGAVEDRTTTVLVSAGYRVADPIEVFLAASRTVPTARAEAELPSSNVWEGRAVVRVVF